MALIPSCYYHIYLIETAKDTRDLVSASSSRLFALSFAVQNVLDILPRAVPNHGQRAGRVANGSGEELARQRHIHLRQDVMIGGGLVDDAFQQRGALRISSQPPIDLGQAEIDKQKLLPLIP